MTDYELLTLAANAAGVVIEDIQGSLWVAGEEYERWDPLADDGLAFRLMVKLHLEVSVSPQFVYASLSDGRRVMESGFIDLNAATRRAIVRAAAAMSNLTIKKD